MSSYLVASGQGKLDFRVVKHLDGWRYTVQLMIPHRNHLDLDEWHTIYQCSSHLLCQAWISACIDRADFKLPADLEDRYDRLTPDQRESEAAAKYGSEW